MVNKEQVTSEELAARYRMALEAVISLPSYATLSYAVKIAEQALKTK